MNKCSVATIHNVVHHYTCLIIDKNKKRYVIRFPSTITVDSR